VASLAANCDVVFLAVPDAAIAPTCEAIIWRPGQVAVHCSGAVGLDALASAVASGATAGCLHPLQSFATREPHPERFAGIACGVEGADPAGSMLQEIVRDLGARPFRLEGVDRKFYHAAAVFVSNLLVALASAGARLWVVAGLPEEMARESLSPLMLTAAANAAALPLERALTGPVARGDVATVEGHLAALTGHPGLRELYRTLSAELLEIRVARTADEEAALRRLLTGQT
jgi:predicted short-subunit dehydrogenase-like oxidoreductase (DUF2520 family)